LSSPDTRLILIKHARPEVVPGKPPSSWLLSEEGKESCRPLAERVRSYGPEVIITSTEPKANETGLRMSSVLGLPFESAPDLHEARRDTVPYHESIDEWFAKVAAFFSNPNELVLGEETAEQATERFSAAVESLLTRHPGRTIATVCHGTVMSLYAASVAGIDPFPLWQRLGLPSFIVMSPDSREVVKVVDRIS
jgi:broad specificity phosphatase PhoE